MPRHVGLQTGKADSQVLADVGRGDALAQVLEPRTRAISGHAGQVLNLPGEFRIFRELLVDRHAMCRTGAAPIAQAAVIGRTVPQGAANVAVLCEC